MRNVIPYLTNGLGTAGQSSRKSSAVAWADYRIAAFDAPLDSIQAYILYITTHDSYRALRERRVVMPASNQKLSGWEIAETLTAYSDDHRQPIPGITPC